MNTSLRRLYELLINSETARSPIPKRRLPLGDWLYVAEGDSITKGNHAQPQAGYPDYYLTNRPSKSIDERCQGRRFLLRVKKVGRFARQPTQIAMCLETVSPLWRCDFVRCYSNSGQRRVRSDCPLCARSRHLS